MKRTSVLILLLAFGVAAIVSTFAVNGITTSNAADFITLPWSDGKPQIDNANLTVYDWQKINDEPIDVPLAPKMSGHYVSVPLPVIYAMFDFEVSLGFFDTFGEGHAFQFEVTNGEANHVAYQGYGSIFNVDIWNNEIIFSYYGSNPTGDEIIITVNRISLRRIDVDVIIYNCISQYPIETIRPRIGGYPLLTKNHYSQYSEDYKFTGFFVLPLNVVTDTNFNINHFWDIDTGFKTNTFQFENGNYGSEGFLLEFFGEVEGGAAGIAGTNVPENFKVDEPTVLFFCLQAGVLIQPPAARNIEIAFMWSTETSDMFKSLFFSIAKNDHLTFTGSGFVFDTSKVDKSNSYKFNSTRIIFTFNNVLLASASDDWEDFEVNATINGATWATAQIRYAAESAEVSQFPQDNQHNSTAPNPQFLSTLKWVLFTGGLVAVSICLIFIVQKRSN